eukprot:1723200-Alexandrium_andersonii.AAC.1
MGARSAVLGAHPLSQGGSRRAGRSEGASPGREEKKSRRRGNGDHSAESRRQARGWSGGLVVP